MLGGSYIFSRALRQANNNVVYLHNMKKAILPFLLLFATIKIVAQANVYKPFATTYQDWKVEEDVYGGSGSFTYSSIYYVSGDTMIHSLNYKKVNYINQGLCYCPPAPINQIFTGGTYNFAYRNDSLNKKVYIILLGDTAERLWYDFNLNLGDTLKNTYSAWGVYTSPSMIITVSAIDSVLICNNYYKRFKFACPNPVPFAPIYLTESIGFSTNFINQSLSDNCQFEPIRLYTTSSLSINDCPNGLGINNLANNNVLAIFPNPASNSFTIQNLNAQPQTLHLFDVSGNLVLLQTIAGTTTINVSSLNAGVYNASITSAQGTANKRLVIVK